MADYFQKLPIIPFGGTFARNLMTRVSFNENLTDGKVFYPYTIKEEHARADVISDLYYDDPEYDWLIYLSNNVTDPYFDLGQTQQNFDKYIAAKYGSAAIAQQITMFYRNDWSADDSIMSPSQYNALLGSWKKYYNPIFGYNNQINGYERIKEDWTSGTNQIVELAVTANTAFPVDAIVTQNTSSGTVSFSNTSILTLKHITGTFTNNSVHSNTLSMTVTGTNQIINAIDPGEYMFWSPVSAYEYEMEQNTQKRDITLLDNRYVAQVETEITGLLND